MTITQQYTSEQTLQVLQLYAAGVSPENIAQTIERSTRSVISKLVREGVYKAPEAKAPRLKKAEMIEQIAQRLELDAEQLESLEKATHGALVLLHSSICRD